MTTNIYASFDLKFQYLNQPEIENPTVDYVWFQMWPLPLFSNHVQILQFDLKWVYLDPFIPNLVNLGDKVQTALDKTLCMLFYSQLLYLMCVSAGLMFWMNL